MALSEGGRGLIWEAVIHPLRHNTGRPVLLVGDSRWAFFPWPERIGGDRTSYEERERFFADIAAAVSREVEEALDAVADEKVPNVEIGCPSCGAKVVTNPYSLLGSKCHSCEYQFAPVEDKVETQPPKLRFGVIDGGKSEADG